MEAAVKASDRVQSSRVCIQIICKDDERDILSAIQMVIDSEGII